MQDSKKNDLLKDNNIKNNENVIWIVFAILISIAFISVIWIKTGIYFETNDDIFISDILSGSVTGAPDFHTVYNGVALSFPLMILYRIMPGVAWYSLFLLILKVITVLLPLLAIYAYSQNILVKVLSTATSIMIFFSFIYMHSNVQYTSIAISAAFFGFLCILIDDKKSNVIYFCVLEYLAYNTRIQSMEIIQPIGFLLLVSVTVCNLLDNKKNGKNNNKKNVLSRIGIPLAASLIIIIGGNILYSFSYRTDEWKDFLKVNQARTLMVDYMRVPDSSEIENILNDNNVSVEEYNAYISYMNYSWDNSNGVIEKVADYVSENTKSEKTIGEIIKWVLYDSYSGLSWNINYLLISSWIVCIILIIYSGNMKYMLCMMAYFLSKLISWGYIYEMGRMPHRIIIPLCQVELTVALFISYLCIISKLRENKKSQKWVLFIGTGILSLVLGRYALITARDQYRYICKQFEGTKIMSQVRAEVSEYCNNNNDKTYLVSQAAYMYWTRGIFDYGDLNDNWRYSGGWFGSMPGNTKYVEEYLNDEVFYFIAPYGEKEWDSNIAKQLLYLESKYDADISIYDYIYLQNGGIYVVYQVYAR